MDSLRDICNGVSTKRAEARARLAKEAQPGTTWGAEGYKFGVLVLGEVVRGSVRCHRFDGEAFLGHMDVLNAADYLLDCFGVGAKLVAAPEWMR